MVRLRATSVVLVLMCLMYAITYIDRVNVSMASAAFGKEFGLTNTQLGAVFSAFAWPYLAFQVVGGWVGDRFGPRRVLTICAVVWGSATLLTGLSGGLVSMIAARVLLGIGEGATFPTCTGAMSRWFAPDQRGWVQGVTHACARVGNAITPALVAFLLGTIGWRGAFYFMGAASLVWALVWGMYFRDDPHSHPAITAAERARLPDASTHATRPAVPWAALVGRMAPVTIVYFCYGWTLWLFLSWIPQYFLHAYKLNIAHSAGFSTIVFAAGVIGDLAGGFVSDRVLRATGSLVRARRDMVILGMLGALACLVPMLFTTNLALVTACLAGGFFFAEFTIGPMWAIPMDIAPRYAGTASGLMNTGSALAAIVSPLLGGVIIDATGNWNLPFVGSMVLLLLGAGLALRMHPERPFAAG